jgi:hypothetical protein
VELVDFLLARIAEDEAAARAVPPLGHNYDMGGKRQDERWVFDRTLPSSADGLGNWSQHRGPETAGHFARWDPARALGECQAKRAIVNTLDGIAAAAADTPGVIESAVYRGMARAMEEAVRMVAAVYGDHPDYREEWRA